MIVFRMDRTKPVALNVFYGFPIAQTGHGTDVLRTFTCIYDPIRQASTPILDGQTLTNLEVHRTMAMVQRMEQCYLYKCKF